MVADTTVNIGCDLLDKLAGAADCTGISKSRLISVLLRRVAGERQLFITEAIRVRYQERKADGGWHCLHVSIRRDEFEFYTDLRCLCKFSVSFLIAYAIEHYLDEVVALIRGDADSYRYKNYAIYQIIDNGVICWVRCWGLPTRINPETNPT